MDRITKSFLTEFKNNNGFNKLKDNESFEHFVNYTIVEPKSESRIDIEDINIGIDGTIGIDGFAILLNNQIIYTKEEMIDFLSENKRSCEAEVVFIQSKTSPHFNIGEINTFGSSIEDFISENPKLNWTDIAKKKIELFDLLVSKISELKNNPICSIYYITLGKKENDRNLITTEKKIKENIERQEIFSNVTLEIIGAVEIQKKYKKIVQSIEKTINFNLNSKVALPAIEGVSEAYIGIIDGKEIINLMLDEDGKLMTNIFYDNVRDYQGANKVNIEIAETLKSREKDSFVILNNGITIVTEELKSVRNQIILSNYQIINGCQTSHVLYENRNFIDNTVKIPIKLIVSKNENLISNMIRSTNRQTEVKEQDLIAFTNFQKQLEDYYNSFSGEERLYYERRAKQFNQKAIDKTRIIDKTTQIKAIASMFYKKPNMATRFFGSLFSEFGNKLFNEKDEKLPYYVAALAVYKLDFLFKNKLIDKKYKKIKYHILTMLRLEINKADCPPFSSKKTLKYCEEIKNILINNELLLNLINEITTKIDGLDYDLESLELSKSKEFVKSCLELYGIK